MDKDFLFFSHDFQQQIYSSLETNDENEREDKFTETMINCLLTDGVLEDGAICNFRGYGMKINGYYFREDHDTLDLFVSHYTATAPPQSVRTNDLETGIKRALSFFTRSINQAHNSLEKNTPAYDLAMQINSLKEVIKQVNVYFFTDGIIKKEFTDAENLDGVEVNYHVWDIERLYRSLTSGREREVIEIDFEEFGESIPCLPLNDQNNDYLAYLVILPGEVLAKIYGEYGSRLLERNVRSFLQARGNVNKGIRKTLKNEPHMFFAYNNGLSAVAQSVETVRLPNGGVCISKIKDLQIVNGGQTTASIYHAFRKDRLDLKGVNVQVKLTVVRNSSDLDEIVPLISEFANSQNKVQVADFSANDPYHRKIQELSRTIWAPNSQGSHRQTRWYYERARGQYLDDRGREHTLSYKKGFDSVYPKSKLFTKTDLAKYQNTWNQMPHLVSKGAQKNFYDFTLWLDEQLGFEPDRKYFERLIATAIMFRRTEKIVQEQKYGAYRANIVTYTLAWISHATDQRIDLDGIWRNQDISSALKEAIIQVSRFAYQHITEAPGNGNVTEWCKKKDCWETFKAIEIELGQDLLNELVD